MSNSTNRFLILFALAAVTASCRSRAAAPAPVPAVPPDVWAVVDGRQIHRDEVEKTYRRTAQPNQASSDDEVMTAKLSLLDQMIVEDIMMARARELKIELPESDLDAAFNEGKKGIGDDAFAKELAGRGLTVADMREGLRRDLTVQKLIEREVTSKIAVADADVAAFFQANKAQFNLREDAYHIAQIIVTPVKEAQITNRTGDDATSPQAAAAKAQMLMERLKAGTAFSELAMDYSEDQQSAPRGGDVGLVPVSALRQAAPQLRDAVMKAQPNSLKLVEIDGGYTIVAVLAKQAAGQRDPSMPEVRDSITSALRERREQLMRSAYIDAARNKATVVNNLAAQLVESQGKLSSPPPPPALK